MDAEEEVLDRLATMEITPLEPEAEEADEDEDDFYDFLKPQQALPFDIDANMEEEFQRGMQEGAFPGSVEEYLYRVRLEANKIGPVIRLQDKEEKQEACASSSSSSCNTTPEKPPKVKVQKERKTKDAPYLRRLCELDAPVVSPLAPNDTWQTDALQYFVSLKQYVAQGRPEFPEDGTSVYEGTPDPLLEWGIPEWRAWIKATPPCFDSLRVFDSVRTCRLLNVLADAFHGHAFKKETPTPEHVDDDTTPTDPLAESSSSSSAMPDAQEDADIGEQEEGEANQLEGEGEMEDGTVSMGEEEAVVPGDAIVSVSQWTFSMLVCLDEVQALDEDVSHSLQKIRRHCERIRKAMEPNPDLNLLPSLNMIITITREYFKQK